MSVVDPKKIRAVEEKSDIVMKDPTKKQILKFVKAGDRVSYIAKDGKYRTGGFVMTIAEDGSSFALSGGKLRFSVLTSNLSTIFIVSKE
jgi:hypothetical protein